MVQNLISVYSLCDKSEKVCFKYNNRFHPQPEIIIRTDNTAWMLKNFGKRGN